jgi:Zn-dependent protease
MEDLIQTLALYATPVLLAITLHEAAHGYVAKLFGDPTASLAGSVSLNPIRHIDPIGTIAIPALMIFLPILAGYSGGFAMIGWGKPVQISLPNPKTRRVDDILITLAGPAMNLVLCLGFALIGGLGGLNPLGSQTAGDATFVHFLLTGIFMNAALVVFNLIPIPPLDGSRLALRLGIFSEEIFYTLARWGFVILLVLINIPFFRQMMSVGIEFLAFPFLLLWGLFI